MRNSILDNNRLTCFYIFSLLIMLANRSFAVGGLDRQEKFDLFGVWQFVAMVFGSLVFSAGAYQYLFRRAPIKKTLIILISGVCVACLPGVVVWYGTAAILVLSSLV